MEKIDGLSYEEFALIRLGADIDQFNKLIAKDCKPFAKLFKLYKKRSEELKEVELKRENLIKEYREIRKLPTT